MSRDAGSEQPIRDGRDPPVVTDERPLRAHSIAVFGSSEPLPGDKPYEIARHSGRLLAVAGAEVVTGGYGGVMEAASRGAREAGGRTLGVTCRIFSERTPNRWLDRQVETVDLMVRTRELIDAAQGFLILPGRSGTLAELAQLWALDRAGCLGVRPVVLLGDDFREVVDLLAIRKILEPRQLQMTQFVATAELAVEAFVERLRERE